MGTYCGAVNAVVSPRRMMMFLLITVDDFQVLGLVFLRDGCNFQDGFLMLMDLTLHMSTWCTDHVCSSVDSFRPGDFSTRHLSGMSRVVPPSQFWSSGYCKPNLNSGNGFPCRTMTNYACSAGTTR